MGSCTLSGKTTTAVDDEVAVARALAEAGPDEVAVALALAEAEADEDAVL